MWEVLWNLRGEIIDSINQSSIKNGEVYLLISTAFCPIFVHKQDVCG